MLYSIKKIAALAAAACLLLGMVHVSRAAEADQDLVGAWRGRVQFTSGSLTSVKDLDFMYVFNLGGTLIESSNYDGAPPVPPAYGIWRKVGERKYQAKYSYYAMKAPARFEEIAKGGGWGPDGYGVITQEIQLAVDGRSFDSTLTYEVFDRAGKLVEKAAVATAKASRLEF